MTVSFAVRTVKPQHVIEGVYYMRDGVRVWVEAQTAHPCAYNVMGVTAERLSDMWLMFVPLSELHTEAQWKEITNESVSWWAA